MTATPNGQYKPDRSEAALARRAHLVVQDQAHECIEVLRVLLRAASEGAAAVQDETAWQMRDYGLDPVALDSSAGLTLAARRAGRGGGRSLLLWAHPDGPPFDGADDWSVPPFAGEVREGRIYGWTIADDLSGVAVLLLLPRILRIMRVDPAGDVLLVSAPGFGAMSGIAAALEAGFIADAYLQVRPPESGAGLVEIAALAAAENAEIGAGPFYRMLAGAVQDVTGRSPRFHTDQRTSDGGQPVPAQDGPVFRIGPRAGGFARAGGVDEWLDIEEFLQQIAVVALTAARWCAGEQPREVNRR